MGGVDSHQITKEVETRIIISTGNLGFEQNAGFSSND